MAKQFNDLLARIAAKQKVPSVTRYRGMMVVDPETGNLACNIQGVVLPVTYFDPLVLDVGDAVVVDLVGGARGQKEAIVTGRLHTTYRESTAKVTVVPPSSQTITITIGANTYLASFVSSYTPVVNDVVSITWNRGIPTVVGKYGTSYTPPPPYVNSTPKPKPITTTVKPPPPPPSTGANTYSATQSGTYTPGLGGWDRWRGGGGYVHQGGLAWGGFGNNGAWFYNGGPRQLLGRTITKIEFTIGSRVPVGYYNSAVVVHLYAHTSRTRPAGDVSRVLGPFNVTIPAGSGQRVISLPLSWAATILNGGGVAMTGEQYAAFHGRNTQPASGKLKLYWRR